jgi:ubiquinone/menaquinone biosynthesis C-methylase UbiE
MTTCTSMFGVHHRLAEIALRHVTDSVAPKILDLASGNGGLSRRLLDKHPHVEVTVTDLDPMIVANLTLSDLGNHPRALVCDATAIDAPDGYFDLAVFARPFRHVPPATVTWILAEGTRVASKLLIIDVGRLPSPLHTNWRAAASASSFSSVRIAPAHHRVPAAYADPAITAEVSAEGHSAILPPAAAKNRSEVVLLRHPPTTRHLPST